MVLEYLREGLRYRSHYIIVDGGGSSTIVIKNRGEGLSSRKYLFNQEGLGIVKMETSHGRTLIVGKP